MRRETNLALVPAKKQSLFFSATLAPNIVSLAQGLLTDPARVTITPEVTTAERIEQQLCFVDRGNKMYLLQELLEKQSRADAAKPVATISRTSRYSRGLPAASGPCHKR